MSFIYRSKRVGKNGKVFEMLKLRTLKEGSNGVMFASGDAYTRFGHTLRKWKLDELPQLWNVVKRDMNLVGPRPEEQRTIDVLPQYTKEILLSVRPGITSLASIHFADEEKIIQLSTDETKDYWSKIKPMKILFDVFYVQNKSVLLDLAIVWLTLRRLITRR